MARRCIAYSMPDENNPISGNKLQFAG